MARSLEPPRHYAATRTSHPSASSSSSSTSAVGSCVVAALFLLLAVGGAATALFLLYWPRAPDIAVTAVQVQLPSFSFGNGTVTFTFQQIASVRNPNRAPLVHYDSSLRVGYAGREVGSMYIPAGQIDGGRTQFMATSFNVPAFPFAPSSSSPDTITVAASGPSPALAALARQQAPPVIEVDSLLVIKGRVTVFGVLTHHVEATKLCRIGVSLLDGRVLGFRC